MRHVIYLLLVANLVFFGWHMLELQKQDEIVRALPAIPATAAPLVTLQEMEQKQEQEPVSELELESARGPMGLPIERDLHWEPKTLAEIAREIFAHCGSERSARS